MLNAHMEAKPLVQDKGIKTTLSHPPHLGQETLVV